MKTYTYHEHKTGRAISFQGTFTRWSEPTGVLNDRLAIFATATGTLMIPTHQMTMKTFGECYHISRF